jgi:exopolysaccharide/PEP-CTERM locus tyrosine autokinase
LSRIEQALEKAVRMRETGEGETIERTVISLTPSVTHSFKAAEPAVDLKNVDSHVVCITDPRSAAAEQYRKLKARILNATASDFLNTIMVTSSDAAEGKSLTALNLAITLAEELDLTVLLVDADLRKPTLHQLLGLNSPKGLSEYLKGEIALDEALIRTGIGKLVLLPGGEPPENAAELLSSERMKLLIDELKSRYKDRYIIFDSSPLLVTADPLSFGKYVKNIIFVLQEGRTSEKSARQALSLMKGWNILGVVFNNAFEYREKNRYAYYYRYGQKTAQETSEDGNGKKGGIG